MSIDLNHPAQDFDIDKYHSISGYNQSFYRLSIPLTIISSCIIIFSNILSNSHILILKNSYGYSKMNIILITIAVKSAMISLIMLFSKLLSAFIDFNIRFYVSISIFLMCALIYLFEVLKLIEDHDAALTIVDADIYIHTKINEKTELLLPKVKSPIHTNRSHITDEQNLTNRSRSGQQLLDVKEKSKFFTSKLSNEEEKTEVMANQDGCRCSEWIADVQEEGNDNEDNVIIVREPSKKEISKTTKDVRGAWFQLNFNDFKLLDNLKNELNELSPLKTNPQNTERNERQSSKFKRKQSIKNIRNSIMERKDSEKNILIIELEDLENFDEDIENELEEENILILKKSVIKKFESKFPWKFCKKFTLLELQNKNLFAVFSLYFLFCYNFIEIFLGALIGIFLMILLVFTTKDFFSNLKIIYWMMTAFSFYVVVCVIIYTRS